MIKPRTYRCGEPPRTCISTYGYEIKWYIPAHIF